VVAVVGSDERTDRSEPPNIEVVSLTEQFGETSAFAEPKRLVEQATATWLSARR
jgi:hypothetical protein